MDSIDKVAEESLAKAEEKTVDPAKDFIKEELHVVEAFTNEELKAIGKPAHWTMIKAYLLWLWLKDLPKAALRSVGQKVAKFGNWLFRKGS